jgi:hypothetical protein
MMHGEQSSDEMVHLIRKIGGRGLKSFQDLYYERKFRSECYMSKSEN